MSFEVDRTSAFRPAVIDQPLGALIRCGIELQVYVGTKNGHGFSEATRATLVSDLAASSADTEVGFTRWRAVVDEGPHRITVYTYEATKTASL